MFILETFHPFLYHAFYFYPCTCMLYVIHVLLAHLHCLILAPSLFHSLTIVAMHCLIRMSPYSYLIHGTKYFRGDWIFHIQCWNIQSRGDKMGGTKIFMTCPQTPLLLHACMLMHTYTSNIHVIPLQKILAMGLLLYNQISTETYELQSCRNLTIES